MVYKQEIRRRGGDVRDPRWLLELCWRCHFEHHNPGLDDERILPLRVLPDAAIEAAADLLGAWAAYEYLRRRYRGDDPRVAALVDEGFEVLARAALTPAPEPGG